ncbi:serine/threonine protein kinase [Streptomyces lonarensis]|uniref:Protein kinase n=1 Tax=Streptomyces lonarensis TaxID=700599 RepID=A0A7X6HZD9_9ACTN|nr:serine/threonine-protein kinase [Streptomyces lonarensis]NJQ06521.1 protein kinase [Streptomyces lonarensis]
MERLTPDDPSQVGGYPLLGILGEGGMGRVYLAQSPGGRALALKTIRSELTRDPGFRSRFEREIRNSDRVRSSWTVPVVDWSRSAEGRQWLAAEYVPAPSLLDWTDQHGPIDGELLPLLAKELARALAAVGETGLVHRDLKPSNVLLGPQHPLLIDFGIAHAGDDARFTTTGGVIGSPGYLSPEQACGEENVTPASDVFALAALLHHAATGHGPFLRPGESPSVPTLLYRVVHHEPDLGGLPADVREALTDAFAKNPADRPAPTELADRFSRILRGPARWQEGLPAELRADHQRREAEVAAVTRAGAVQGPPSGGFVTQGSFGPPIAPPAPAHHQGPPPGPHNPLGPHTPPSSYPGQPAGPYGAPGTPPPGALNRGPGGASGNPDDDRPWAGIARRSCIAVIAIGGGIVALMVLLYVLAMDTSTPGDVDDNGAGTSTGAEKRGPEDEVSTSAGDDGAETVVDEDEGGEDDHGTEKPEVAVPHQWTGEWRGVDFQIALWLEDGAVGETVGRFESVFDDTGTGQEYRCVDSLELTDVSAGETELSLATVETERVGPADIADPCALNREYIAGVDGEYPDELWLHIVTEGVEYDPYDYESDDFELSRE